MILAYIVESNEQNDFFCKFFKRNFNIKQRLKPYFELNVYCIRPVKMFLFKLIKITYNITFFKNITYMS